MIDGRPWFERFPDLEAWELRRFERRGFPVRVDDERRAQGQLVISTAMEFRDELVEVLVRYPSEYPELPPLVYGPAGLLDRHQHRLNGNFCLLERPLDDWNARDWGAADLIAAQLTKLLADSEAGPAVVRANEAPMPEPATAYYAYARDAAVVVPGELSSPAASAGELRVGRITPHLWIVQAVGATQSDGALDQVLPSQAQVRGKWRRFDRAPNGGSGDALSLVAWLRAEQPGLLSRPVPPVLSKSRLAQDPIEIVGLVFPEEGPGVGELRDAWIFVCLDRTEGPERAFLFHAQVMSAPERGRRIPELAGLVERRAVILGLGSIGGSVAIELARAGVGHLDLVDFDRFEATNTVRHPLGLDYAGLPKTSAVAIACRRANPYCEPVPHELCLGSDYWSQGAAPSERLAGLIDGAHVVIEATGSHQVAQYASRLCAEADVPLIAGWMTDGFHGAELVRIKPPKTMCWTCFATAAREGRLPQAMRGPTRSVVVQGCSHPTVEGAGFDVAEACAVLTRLVVGTLAPAGGYPDTRWNYAVLNLRAPDDFDTPRMTTDLLKPNEECAECRRVAGSTVARMTI